jgi:flagellar hook-associated protein 2
MSTSSTTAAASGFSGQSSFAADLQTVITRAVGIASLPITQLQNMQSALTGQQSELQTLGSDFEAVQTSLDSINSSTGTSSYTATSDNTSATPTLSSGALTGSYAVVVSSVGSQTNTISAATTPAVTDPASGNISSSATFDLNISGKDYALTPASTSLDSLVASINSSGANVQATVVNVGGTAAPDYRLSIQSTRYAADVISLNPGNTYNAAANLLSNVGAIGSPVTYTVNGQPATPITSTSRILSISTGLTVAVTAVGTANLTVAQGTASLSSALTSFVTAYNTAADEVLKNRGQDGGALAGQSIVGQLGSSLQSLAGYTSSAGSVKTMADLGLTFDTTGKLAFDPTVLSSAAATSLPDVLSFIGSESTGGFLQTADEALLSITDPTVGTISQATQSIGTSVTSLTTRIAAKQDQVTRLQSSLNAQMAAADTAISALQSQATEITNLFAAETQASKNITG